MDQRTVTGWLRGDGEGATALTLPPAVVRAVGALLALAVSVVHVADQGGITAFTDPDWLGWAYRLIEVGGVLVAATLLWPRTSRLGWLAAVLQGAAPFFGYLTSRTIGVPGDPGDVGNWGDWLGTAALTVEVGLVTLSLGMIFTMLKARGAFAVPADTRSLEAAERLEAGAAAQPRV